MDAYGDTVRRLCLVRLKRREDTEDIFQTVFLKYLQQDRPFESPEHEKAWFIRVTLAALAERRSRSAPRRPLAAALAALALAVLTAAGGLAYATPAAAVSVDADASVELAVNAFGRVVGVTCYDEAALAGEDAASVTVSADSGRCERLLSDGGAAGLTCYALDPEAVREARDAGLSLGKYRAYLTLSALDPTVTQDEAGEMTMGELQQCIDACQGHGSGQGQTAGETAAGQQTGTQESGGHHGQGHGHGHE